MVGRHEFVSGAGGICCKHCGGTRDELNSRRGADGKLPTCLDAPDEYAPPAKSIFRRVVMPPTVQTIGEVVFPSRSSRSCTVIMTRVMHSQNGVRKTLAHDLVVMGVGHGSIRRVSATQVDVMIVLPSDSAIALHEIAFYFHIKWSVVTEDYTVEYNNFTNVTYLNKGIIVFKSSVPDPEGRSLDEDLDMISVDGYSVVSDR